MRYIIIILVLSFLIGAFALAESNARYDWTNGESAPLLDGTATTQTKVDWVNGEPTAVDQFVEATGGATISFKAGTTQFKAGTISYK